MHREPGISETFIRRHGCKRTGTWSYGFYLLLTCGLSLSLPLAGIRNKIKMSLTRKDVHTHAGSTYAPAMERICPGGLSRLASLESPGGMNIWGLGVT